MVVLLDNDVVGCFDEGVVACSYQCVVAILDKNNKYYFDVYIRYSLDVCLCFLSLHTPW